MTLDQARVIEIERQAVAANDDWGDPAEFRTPEQDSDGSWSVLAERTPSTRGGHRIIMMTAAAPSLNTSGESSLTSQRPGWARFNDFILTHYQIFYQASGKIRRMELPSKPNESLKKWTDFVSKRIREARTAAGLTQGPTGGKSGLPQSHISRLESGQHTPSAKTLEKIAEALGLSVADFDPSV